MTKEPQFRITVKTDEATVYSENLPSFPVPRVGDDVYTSGDAHGFWRVLRVWWLLPAKGAMEPTMEAILEVEWSDSNERPAPTYGDRGWVQGTGGCEDDG
jgi:hypothetical protein